MVGSPGPAEAESDGVMGVTSFVRSPCASSGCCCVVASPGPVAEPSANSMVCVIRALEEDTVFWGALDSTGWAIKVTVFFAVVSDVRAWRMFENKRFLPALFS